MPPPLQRSGGTWALQPRHLLMLLCRPAGLPHTPCLTPSLPTTTRRAGGGLGAGAVAVIVLAVVAVLGGAGYLAYQYRIRSIMQQEVGTQAEHVIRCRDLFP